MQKQQSSTKRLFKMLTSTTYLQSKIDKIYSFSAQLQKKKKIAKDRSAIPRNQPLLASDSSRKIKTILPLSPFSQGSSRFPEKRAPVKITTRRRLTRFSIYKDSTDSQKFQGERGRARLRSGRWQSGDPPTREREEGGMSSLPRWKAGVWGIAATLQSTKNRHTRAPLPPPHISLRPLLPNPPSTLPPVSCLR